MPPQRDNPDPAGAAIPVCVTGLGLISPLGRSLWATARALTEGRSTTDPLDRAQGEMDLDPDPASHPALALTRDPYLLAQTVGCVGRIAPWPEDPAIELADRAAREAALDAAGAEPTETLRGVRTIVASSKGAILSLIDERWKNARPIAAALGPHELLAHRLRARLGLGHTTSVVAACATAGYALHQARCEIERGAHDRILVVAVEAAIHPIFVHTYKRLGVLTPTDDLRAHRPRPLDNNRDGFTLVEIAAAALLEREDRARASASRVRARLLGTSVGTQPHDIVRPAPVFTALSSCVARAVPRGTPIALIHPHATGTRDNDPRELAAIATALPGSTGADVYAVKGALGHPLGASALVNLALACALAKLRTRPLMLWLTDPIDSPFDLTASARPIPAGAHLITTAGFGGHVAAACIQPT